jgi:predicted nucleic acid-binding protein
VLLDTSAAILLLRRHPPAEAEALIRVAKAEIEDGRAVLPAVAVTELLVGERRPLEAARLMEALTRVPAVLLPVEAARLAGAMGAFLAGEGGPAPLPDLMVAATAAWLDVPLLTWDGDFARWVRLARTSGSRHPGVEAWRRLNLHPASRSA